MAVVPLGDSVDCFDTAFTKVSLHVAVCRMIAGACLIAVSVVGHVSQKQEPKSF